MKRLLLVDDDVESLAVARRGWLTTGLRSFAQPAAVQALRLPSRNIRT